MKDVTHLHLPHRRRVLADCVKQADLQVKYVVAGVPVDSIIKGCGASLAALLVSRANQRVLRHKATTLPERPTTVCACGVQMAWDCGEDNTTPVLLVAQAA